jgi:hypothetical protein
MQVLSSGELGGVVTSELPHETVAMDTDRYPTGSRVDVWWAGDKEWYTASVLKTRTEPHTIDGTKALCRPCVTTVHLTEVELAHRDECVKVQVKRCIGKAEKVVLPIKRVPRQGIRVKLLNHELADVSILR